MVISLQSSSQASDCTGTYGGSSALPTVLASKCDSTTCDTITSDLDVVKECFKGKFYTILFDSHQIWNSSTKSVLKMSFFPELGLNVIKSIFFTDPSATSCTGTYSATDGTMLPSVLADKCTTTTCDTLTSDLTVVKDCFTGTMAPTGALYAMARCSFSMFKIIKN